MIELIDTYWLYFLVGQYPHGPLGGLALTLILTVLGLLFAFPLGLVFGIARVSPWRSVRWPVSALIQVVRGTPLLMVVFWAYFFLPSLTGQNTNQFWTMLTALVVFDAAYLAEIIRAGIQGLGKGQTESARSLGLSYLAAMQERLARGGSDNLGPSTPAQADAFGRKERERWVPFVRSLKIETA